MNATAESYGPAVIVNVKGELNEEDLDTVRQVVQHNLEDQAVIDVVFNLEEVPFIDSVGLEYLVDLQEQLAERMGRVKLCKADENVSKILEITRLDSTFEIYQDVPEAVKTIQP